MRRLAVVLLAALSIGAFTGTYAQPTALTTSERDAALAEIKKWRGFEGTWEGEVKYVAAPKDDWYKQRVPIKIVVKSNEPHVYVRNGIRDWLEVGSTYKTSRPDELTLVIHAYGAAGVWTENNVVVLTRKSDNNAVVYVQRVVNNWAGHPLPGEDLIYGDSRIGTASRQQ